MKKTKLIYENMKTGAKVEFRKPDRVTYVYDSPEGKKFLTRHELIREWKFVPEESHLPRSRRA